MPAMGVLVTVGTTVGEIVVAVAVGGTVVAVGGCVVVVGGIVVGSLVAVGVTPPSLHTPLSLQASCQ